MADQGPSRIITLAIVESALNDQTSDLPVSPKRHSKAVSEILPLSDRPISRGRLGPPGSGQPPRRGDEPNCRTAGGAIEVTLAKTGSFAVQQNYPFSLKQARWGRRLGANPPGRRQHHHDRWNIGRPCRNTRLEVDRLCRCPLRAGRPIKITARIRKTATTR